MKDLHGFIEIMGKLREGNPSAAASGFDVAFLAWLCAPENLNRDQILHLCLFSVFEKDIRKLSIIADSTQNTDICNIDTPETNFVRFIRREESARAYPEASLYIDRHRNEIFGILKDIHNLKRSGWLTHRVSHPESVAEHSCSLALSALLLTPQNMNRGKTVTMALLHDIQEIRTGDFTPDDNISPEEKGRLEQNAVWQIAGDLNKPEMLELFTEYEKCATPESRFVKDLDRLDAVLLAACYDRHQRAPQPLLPEFLSYAEKKYLGGYGCETVKDIYCRLKNETNNHPCANRE